MQLAQGGMGCHSCNDLMKKLQCPPIAIYTGQLFRRGEKGAMGISLGQTGKRARWEPPAATPVSVTNT